MKEHAKLQDVMGGFAELEQRQMAALTRKPSDDGKVGRNDPCPCGSDKRYKKCHGH